MLLYMTENYVDEWTHAVVVIPLLPWATCAGNVDIVEENRTSLRRENQRDSLAPLYPKGPGNSGDTPARDFPLATVPSSVSKMAAETMRRPIAFMPA